MAGNYNDALSGLGAIKIEDLPKYKNLLELGMHKAWCYYFPFLFLFSQSKNRTILVGEDSGSMCFYLLRENVGKQPKLSLYFPPLPMNTQVLKNCFQRIHDFKKSHNASILWIDEHHLDELKNVSGINTALREHEYIYSPDNFSDLSGGNFRKLRQNLSKVNQLENIEMRSYQSADMGECLELLKGWRGEQGDKYEGNADYSYVRYCLKMSELFNEKDLYGKVFLIDGKIRSFGFVGETHSGMGNLFIGKSDHSVQGLNYFMQYHLILSMQAYPLLNNASDMGYPGLRFAKEHLRPIAMHGVYKARQKGRL